MTCSCGKTMRASRRPYRYLESGLDNVVLTGIRVWECPNGHRQPEIPNIEGLHRLIATLILEGRGRLRGRDVRFLRKHLGYAANKFANLLGVTPVTVSRWENEAEPIGPTTERLVRTLCSVIVSESVRRNPEVVLRALEGLVSSQRRHEIRVRRASGGEGVPAWVAAQSHGMA